MNKIIATDLDGTLFYPKDHKNMICNSNLFFLQSFIDKGGKVVLVTGRSVDYGHKVCKTIGRDCSIIAFNGACVFHENKLIKEVTIPNVEAKELIAKACLEYGLPGVFLMTSNGLFIHLKYKSKLIRLGYKLYYSSLKIYAEKIDITESSYEKELENGRIFKIMLFFGLGNKNKQKASNVNKIIREKYSNIEANWSKNVIEITGKGSGKALTLEKLCEDFNINKDDIYVIGDSGNDISMFKTFHEHSFCMSHAPENVKKYAKYTLDNFEDLSRYIY